MAIGTLLAALWVGLDRWLLPFGGPVASARHVDLPLGSQTSAIVLLGVGVMLLATRMISGRRGMERIFTLAFGICILITSILFHFVMFEHIGRQWLHDALEVSQTPLAASDEKRGEVCRHVLLGCRTQPLEDADAHTNTGSLLMLRSRDRVVLEGAVSLYPLTQTFHQGKSNYMAAYYVRDGHLIELKDNIHPRIIGQVMYLGLNVLSLAVGFVWIAGAFYLISFHRNKLNGRRRISAV